MDIKEFFNRNCTQTFKQKYAKEEFQRWANSNSWNYGDGRMVEADYWELDSSQLSEITTSLQWRSNRKEDAWVDYPIVVKGNINSIERNWDEQWYELEPDESKFWTGFVPTYNDCKRMNLSPTACVDIVLPHKGTPSYFIDICDKKPISDIKIEKLKELGVDNYIEIDAEWILSQTKIPSKIKIKRWLI